MSDGTAGNTPTERYLSKLGRRAFLRLWSYSNLFRDQGIAMRGGEGAELCDLLVIFGSHVIIFSDKDCEFPQGEDVDLAWRRWYKRAILKSARQVWAAERWLRGHPDRVFLDRACQHRLPLSIPVSPDTTFHRIVVAHEVSGRRSRMTGGSGSLVLDLRLVEDDHYRPRSQGGRPFAVGHISRSRGYVHVLDDITLDIVLQALDTATDLVDYLSAKEALIRSARAVGAFGEEELLGHYLSNVDNSGRHVFTLPTEGTNVVFDDTHWSGLRERPEYVRKLEADRISYFWDEVIEAVAGHLLDGTLSVTSSPEVEATPERMLRAMAAESRVQRRVLSRSLREVILGADHPNRLRIRSTPPSKPGQPHYVFVAWGPFTLRDRDEDITLYRARRQEMLGDYCMCLAARLDEPGTVLGIATEGRDSDGRSWDNVLVDSRDLSEEDRQEARQIAEERGWFKNLLVTSGSEDEFPRQGAAPPAAQAHRLTATNRNAPCPCGSGRKYKKCHGRYG
jgi:hypothetical protein